MNLRNRKVTVIGMGNSGCNAAALLDSLGAYVRVTDSGDTPEIRKNIEALEHRDIRVEIGGHTEEFIKDSSLVVVSPGVEDSSPALRWAAEAGIPAISELELGFRFCRGRIIAITGTNGKSTVTSLTGDILKDGGLDTVVCGNIGNSLCGEIPGISEKTFVVLEVSSFQLERTEKFSPFIAVILNITDDHLDRYRAFKDYYNEKLKIFRNQCERDVLILNHDAPNLRGLGKKACSKVLFYSGSEKVNGAYVEEGCITVCATGGEERVIRISEVPLKGLYNVENVLAASLIGGLVGVNASSMRGSIRNFKGLAHRFETAGIVEGVEYIDDSKGTTVDSTRRALESCDRPVILIAGGKDKNSDYGAVKDIVKRKVRQLILIGEAAPRIRKALGDAVDTREARTMSDAVSMARGLAVRDMIVLLSPMCSSFDMFRDYKERGEAFKEAVRELICAA